jgi:hypothetical protein
MDPGYLAASVGVVASSGVVIQAGHGCAHLDKKKELLGMYDMGHTKICLCSSL